MDKRSFGAGFLCVYQQHKLTLGINFPIEAYDSPVANMLDQISLAQHAEQAGFAALWSRDVPLLDPSFGDAGQIYDPWVWLGFMTAHTNTIALGTGSIILPLRASVDLAKAATSVDQLSKGRLILGVASGDRPVEYSVYKQDFEQRGERFKESFQFIRECAHKPEGWDNQLAAYSGSVDMLPKSYRSDLPLLVTGNSRQSLSWIARHSDGWLMYPRDIAQQTIVLKQWREALAAHNLAWKPFSQSLYIDLTKDPDAKPVRIHLGYRLGRNALIEHLTKLQDIGVNHVSFNVRFSTRAVTDVIDELGEYVLPHFPANQASL